MKKLMTMMAVSALAMTVLGMSNPPADEGKAGCAMKKGSCAMQSMKGECCTPDGSCKADGSNCGKKKGSCEMKADCCTPDGSCKADGSSCGMKGEAKKAGACEGGTCELPK